MAHPKHQQTLPLINTLGRNIIPENESERIAALRQYDLLYGPSEEALNNIAHIMADDFDAPIGLVSLVDTDEVIYKGNHGMPGVHKASRGVSLCSLAILSPEPTVITDASEDPCLLSNPLVHGKFGLRFYAGAPITTPDGYCLGSVCIVDFKPRTLNAKEQQRLSRYAGIVMHEMLLRKAFLAEKEALETATAMRQKTVTKEIVKAQEQERTEIGLDLHDNVSQVLTTVKLYNEMVRDGIGDATDILTRSNTFLQQCIDEIRGLSKRLSAPTLGKISLGDSIGELVAALDHPGVCDATLQLEQMSGVHPDKEVYLGVYRIVQEQLENIRRHAGASRVLVRLAGEADGIALKVTDNGRGFDPGRVAAGSGINNMVLRAESLNGRIHIDSSAGAGCVLRVWVPLTAPQG